MYEIPGLKYEIGGFDDEPHERLLNNLRDLMDIRDLIKPARRHLFFQNIGVKSSSTAKNSIRPTNSRDLRCDFIGAGDLEISSAGGMQHPQMMLHSGQHDRFAQQKTAARQSAPQQFNR